MLYLSQKKVSMSERLFSVSKLSFFLLKIQKSFLTEENLNIFNKKESTIS